MAPLVSIITPVYNLEELILPTLESAFAQTLGDFELIIVDDGSTDATIERIGRVRDPRMQLICAPHSGLPAAGRNLAVARAKGKYIAILDGDDLWLPDKLRKQVEFLEEHPTVGMVHTDYVRLLDGRLEPHGNPPVAPGRMPAREALHLLVRGNFVCSPSVVLRRDVLSRVTGFQDTDPNLGCGSEDYDLWLRLAEAGVDFGFLAEPLVHYRVRSSSASSNRPKNLMSSIAALRKARQRNHRLYHTAAFKRRLAYIYRNLGVCMIEAGDPGGLRQLFRAVRYAPFDGRTWGWLVVGLFGKSGLAAFRSLRVGCCRIRDGFLGRLNPGGRAV